jgi:hypothetical protein
MIFRYVTILKLEALIVLDDVRWATAAAIPRNRAATTLLKKTAYSHANRAL